MCPVHDELCGTCGMCWLHGNRKCKLGKVVRQNSLALRLSWKVDILDEKILPEISLHSCSQAELLWMRWMYMYRHNI